MGTLIRFTVDSQTIMSQAWKETSLKVQRVAVETTDKVIYVGNTAKSALNPKSKNRVMMYSEPHSDMWSQDKKLGR